MSVLLAGLLLTAGVPDASAMRFEQAFATAGEPAQIHYRVTYEARGGRHDLEVWRAGDRRLKRVTDGAVATYAEHAPAAPGYRLTVVDFRRRMVTRIDRTSLYRLGSFTDWFDLGHGLRHPMGAYRLTPAAAPRAAPSLLGACRWYDLAQQGRVTRICWDPAHRLPLLIVAADGRPVWRVTAIDTTPLATQTFAIRDRGFIHNDANRDLESD